MLSKLESKFKQILTVMCAVESYVIEILSVAPSAARHIEQDWKKVGRDIMSACQKNSKNRVKNGKKQQ
jgi:hypothetical protein